MAFSTFYERDGIKIILGDCRDVLPTIEPGSVDLVFTSPPYNKGMRLDGGWRGLPTTTSKGRRFRGGYGQHTDDLPQAEYVEWQRGILRSLWNLLSDDGSIYYNHKPRIQNGELWTPLALNPGLPLRQIVIWDTGPGVNIMPGAYVPSHEWVMIFAKPGFKLKSRTHSACSDVWSIPPATPVNHPAPFPIELARKVLVTSGAKRVLDPFMGEGTTLRAAKDLGIEAIGIELEERHCVTAFHRLQQTAMNLEVA